MSLKEILIHYYENHPEYLDIIKAINNRDLENDSINKVEIPSLRKLEHFVVNFSKKYNIKYTIYVKNFKGDVEAKPFWVYPEYKGQLDVYTKKSFDMFRRKCKSEEFIYIDDVETTICQLNFFRWAFENGVVDYVCANLAQISEDMSEHNGKKIKSKSIVPPAISIFNLSC